MRRYPKHKASGVDWLGDIPMHWDLMSLKFCLKKIYSGGTPESGKTSYWSDNNSGIPWVAISDISSSGRTLNYTEKSITEEGLYSKHLEIIPKGILLMSIFASLGKTTRLEINATVNQAILGLSPNAKLNNTFLEYFLRDTERILNYYSSSNTQENLNLNKVKNLQLILPPISEQHAIVRFLDYKTGQIDSFIVNRQKQIELLKEQKAGIINKAVTKGINPNAQMKDSGIEWIGQVPEHWSVSKVKFVARVKGRIGFRGYTVTDLVEEGEGSLTLGATHINKDGGIDLSKQVFISWDKYYESPEIMVEKDDILVVQRGSVGVVGIIDSEIGHATINPSLVVLKKVRMNRYLLFLQLRSKIVKEAIITIFNETAVPMLSQNQISNFNILLPPSQEEQQSIIEFIQSETSTIDTLISKYQKQIDLMQEYRTSLISQAVTGKIDVREWQPKKQQTL